METHQAKREMMKNIMKNKVKNNKNKNMKKYLWNKIIYKNNKNHIKNQMKLMIVERRKDTTKLSTRKLTQVSPIKISMICWLTFFWNTKMLSRSISDSDLYSTILTRGKVNTSTFPLTIYSSKMQLWYITEGISPTWWITSHPLIWKLTSIYKDRPAAGY